MSKIVTINIFEKDAEIILDDGSTFFATFELEKTYSHGFNPGSLYGHYEKFSGYQPEDITFDRQISEELEEEITKYIMENYDYSKY